MTTQHALVLNAPGSPFTLDTAHPIPKPGTEELLIRVKVAALNPVDVRVQKYGVFFTEFPAVGGFDMTGEVVEVGEAFSGRFQPGDRVILASELTTKEYGAFQQYALADAHTVAKLPRNISFDEGATLPAALCTAYVGMYDAKPRGLGLESFLTKPGVYAGQAIFIAGGSGSIGQGAIQFARLSGFEYVITTASPKHREFLQSLGATHVIDRSLSPSELGAALGEIVHLPEILYAFDAVGEVETSFAASLDSVGTHGTVVTVNFMLEPSSVIEKDMQRHGQKTVCKFTAQKTLGGNPQLMRVLWGSVHDLLASGAIKPGRFQVVPGGLMGIPEGLKRLEEGSVSGLKLLVHPHDG